jgi:hypothetical protein
MVRTKHDCGSDYRSCKRAPPSFVDTDAAPNAALSRFQAFVPFEAFNAGKYGYSGSHETSIPRSAIADRHRKLKLLGCNSR